MPFGATYKTNTYGKSLIILVGVNHHSRTTIFRKALLVDVSVEMNTWTLQTFLFIIYTKYPCFVATIGDKATKKATQHVFPNSNH